MGRKLYVGNLPYTTGEQDLQELFGPGESFWRRSTRIPEQNGQLLVPYERFCLRQEPPALLGDLCVSVLATFGQRWQSGRPKFHKLRGRILPDLE